MGNTVIGPASGGHLAIRDVASGSPRFTDRFSSAGLTVFATGPTFAMVIGVSADNRWYVERIDTHGTITRLPGTLADGLGSGSCGLGGAHTVICTGGYPPNVVALDADTGKVLWSLPDAAANRVAPTVTAAWHGAVYGTTSNGRSRSTPVPERTARTAAAPQWRAGLYHRANLDAWANAGGQIWGLPPRWLWTPNVTSDSDGPNDTATLTHLVRCLHQRGEHALSCGWPPVSPTP